MSERADGRVLNGRYALQGVLGGGGMAQVYRARDTVLGRPVAIKVLREQYSQDPNFVQRFNREAQAAANLIHPNIASVYDVGEDGGLHYIVMELVPGETLRDLISRDAPLPPDRAVEIAAQTLSALEYAHRTGLIHRDVKPGNILINPEGTVKVVDFGIAKGATDLSLTGAGLALGTAAYFSPEQAKGERVGPQSDIYAIGVTLYEMLTGRVPFQSDTDVGLAFKHISEAPTPPRQLNPAIPPQLERIVLRAMDKDPANRFASASQMEGALRNYAAFGSQRTAAMPTISAPPPQRAAVEQQYPRQSPSVVSPARRGGGVQVNTGVGGSAFMTWMLGLVALLLLVGGAILALNASAIFNRTTPTPTFGAPTLTVPVVSTAGPTTAPTEQPTEQPTVAIVVPTDAPPSPTLTLAPTATAEPSATARPQVQAPNLTSLTLQDAQNAAQQQGLTIEQVGEVADANHPAGQVVTQDPEPGQPVDQGGVIRVIVSTGPPRFAMPSVINTDGNQAQEFLSGQGLQVDVQQEPSTVYQEGAVTRQEPDPGSEVAVGATVRIWISQGDVVAVPELIGKPQAEAEAALTAIGLIPNSQQGSEGVYGLAIRNVEPGQVFQAGPAAGTLLQRGSRVTLIIRAQETTGSAP